MLSRVLYRRCVTGVEKCRLQDEEDRRDHPDAIPIDWRGALEAMVRAYARECHERVQDGDVLAFLNGMVKCGKLVPYHGGYAFPDRELPSKEDIVRRVDQSLRSIFHDHP